MTNQPNPSEAAIAARRARAAERVRVSHVRRTVQAPEPVRAPEVSVPRDARMVARAAAKADGDQRVVLTSIIAFLTVVGGLAIFMMVNSVKRDRAKVVMDATFVRMHTQQRSFRMINNRFASWPELKASGATLPPRQRVTASNADASHWFMSIRDQDTNLICDRTGELWDESGSERQAVCRPGNE